MTTYNGEEKSSYNLEIEKEKQLSKRAKSGLWVALAGIVSTILLLVVENIGMFQLTDNWKLIVVILGTAIVSQITKWLNS